MTQRLLTHEVARLLGRTPEAVRAMERAGKLRAERIAHVRVFSRAEVERLLRARGHAKTKSRLP